LIGAAIFAGVVFRVPETLPPEHRHPNGLRASLGRMAALSNDRVFRGHVMTSCLAMAGFFTYISGSSFVLQHTYGVSERTYTVVFATNALAMVTTSVAFVVAVERIGAIALRRAGLCATVSASTFLLVTALTGTDRFAGTWIALCALTAGMGFVLPASITLAQRAGNAYAGTASALQGGLQLTCGALVTPLTGLFGFTSLAPMAGLMTVFMALSATASMTIAHPAPAALEAATQLPVPHRSGINR